MTRAPAASEHSLAFNDVVVNRGALGGMIDCAVTIDGRFVYAMRADGLIVATPTGSTAYALSAQGPIVDPIVAAILLVPVAPHALTNRPIAVRDSVVIEITLLRGKDASLHCDGQAHFAAGRGRPRRRAARRAPRAPAASEGSRPFRDAAPEAALERDAGAAAAGSGSRFLTDGARPHAAPAVDPQFRRRRGARGRVRRRLHGADRRDRRRQVDPARCAVAAARRSLRDAAAAARAPSAPRSPPSSTSATQATARAWLADAGSRRRRRAAAAPGARRAGPKPRLDQRPPGDARATRGRRRAPGRPARPARAPVARPAGDAARAARCLRRLRDARARSRRGVARVARGGERRERGERDAAAITRERDALAARHAELSALSATAANGRSSRSAIAARACGELARGGQRRRGRAHRGRRPHCARGSPRSCSGCAGRATRPGARPEIVACRRGAHPPRRGGARTAQLPRAARPRSGGARARRGAPRRDPRRRAQVSRRARCAAALARRDREPARRARPRRRRRRARRATESEALAAYRTLARELSAKRKARRG